MKMKTARLLGIRNLTLVEMPVPEIDPGDVLVKVRKALTCGTDLKMYRRGHPKFEIPLTLGHEFSGVIVEKGDCVQNWEIGDEIMATVSAPCGKCFSCLRNRPTMCDYLMETNVWGAFAEYIRIPKAILDVNAFKKPHSLDFSKAAFLEPMACVTYGLEKLEIHPEYRILIVGAGPIGLMFLHLLNKLGCENVGIIGKRKARLEMARHLGASQVLNVGENNKAQIQDFITTWTKGNGADTVIECTGQLDVWEESLNHVCKGGEILLFGGVKKGLKACFDTTRLHYGEVRLQGVFHHSPLAVKKTYHWLSEGFIDPSRLITHNIPLDDVPEAFEKLDKGSEDTIKYCISMDGV